MVYESKQLDGNVQGNIWYIDCSVGEGDNIVTIGGSYGKPSNGAHVTCKGSTPNSITNKIATMIVDTNAFLIISDCSFV